MNFFWQGILLGLSLSILAGPMLFILIQLGIEKGFRAGITAGLGVWMSDALYIFTAYFGIAYLMQITQWQGFQLWASILGGLVLIIIGASTLLSKPIQRQRAKGHLPAHNWLGYWMKGFLVNTLNPFTAFFWIGVMTTVSASTPLLPSQALLFFGTIIGVIIITDILKVLLAKNLQSTMKMSYLLILRRVSGTALVVFGIILMVKGIIV